MEATYERTGLISVALPTSVALRGLSLLKTTIEDYRENEDDREKF